MAEREVLTLPLMVPEPVVQMVGEVVTEADEDKDTEPEPVIVPDGLTLTVGLEVPLCVEDSVPLSVPDTVTVPLVDGEPVGVEETLRVPDDEAHPDTVGVRVLLTLTEVLLDKELDGLTELDTV